LAPVARDYMTAVMALPAFEEWRAAAAAEPWVRPNSEVD
jgi:glutathione S-transferase